MVGTLLMHMLLWAALGLILGLAESYLNIWRGSGWRISVIGAAGGFVGGAFLNAIPNPPTVGNLSIPALLGALGGAIAALTLATVFSQRGRAIG